MHLSPDRGVVHPVLNRLSQRSVVAFRFMQHVGSGTCRVHIEARVCTSSRIGCDLVVLVTGLDAILFRHAVCRLDSDKNSRNVHSRRRLLFCWHLVPVQ